MLAFSQYLKETLSVDLLVADYGITVAIMFFYRKFPLETR